MPLTSCGSTSIPVRSDATAIAIETAVRPRMDALAQSIVDGGLGRIQADGAMLILTLDAVLPASP